MDLLGLLEAGQPVVERARAGERPGGVPPGTQPTPELLIRGGTVVNADGSRRADVRIVGERIAEIGTVRAIGGQKSFVRGMITIEVLMITVVFGIVGMGLGSIVVTIFNVVGIQASNLFLQILFGGTTLNPVLSITSLFTSLGIVAVIGVIASLYPASVALGIAPVQAMQRN